MPILYYTAFRVLGVLVLMLLAIAKVFIKESYYDILDHRYLLPFVAIFCFFVHYGLTCCYCLHLTSCCIHVGVK